MEEKTLLRNLYKEKRKALSSEELKKMSEQITDHFLKTFQTKQLTISIFLPIKKFNEINTFPLLNLLKEHSCITLPVSDFNDNSIKHVIYSDNTEITENKWGIPEPQNGDTLAHKDIDIVLVPLLICDQEGYRIGYGKGFYDRFLAQCRPDTLFIGLNYFPPISVIKKDTTDIALHYLVSPDKVYKFKKRK